MLVHPFHLVIKRMDRARLKGPRTLEIIKAEQETIQRMLESLRTEKEELDAEMKALHEEFPFLKELPK